MGKTGGKPRLLKVLVTSRTCSTAWSLALYRVLRARGETLEMAGRLMSRATASPDQVLGILPWVKTQEDE